MGWGWLGPVASIAGLAMGGPIGLGIGLGSSLLGKGGSGSGGNDEDTNPEDPYTQLLTQKSAAATKQAAGFNQQGSQSIDSAVNYIKSLTGSDPGAAMDATRQERGRVIDQFDTGRRAVETFGPRGGGMTSALAGSRFNQATSLADITSSARRDAFGLAATLGPQLASLGLSAQQLASMDLNAVISALFAREGIENEKRAQNMQLWGSIAEAGGTLLGAAMDKGKG